MQTTYAKQIETVRDLRTLLSENQAILENTALNVPPTMVGKSVTEIDQALNDAGASISSMKRYEEMEEIPNKRAISLIEKLIDRLQKIGDSSPIQEEAANYVVSFKR